MENFTRRTALAAVPAMAATTKPDAYIRLYCRYEEVDAANCAAHAAVDKAEGERFHRGAPGYVPMPVVRFRNHHCMAEFEIRRNCQPVIPNGTSIEERDRLIADLKAQKVAYSKAREAVGLGELDRAAERSLKQWREMREQISTTPANSLQGVLFKVRELAQSVTDGNCAWDEELAQTAAADLERLVAGGAS